MYGVFRENFFVLHSMYQLYVDLSVSVSVCRKLTKCRQKWGRWNRSEVQLKSKVCADRIGHKFYPHDCPSAVDLSRGEVAQILQKSGVALDPWTRNITMERLD